MSPGKRLRHVKLKASTCCSNDTEETAFELSALTALEYPGDTSKGWFKSHWGHMARHLRTKLTKRDLEGIFLDKLRRSEDLRNHFQYYDRCPKGHANRSYTRLCQLLDRVIDTERKKRNALLVNVGIKVPRRFRILSAKEFRHGGADLGVEGSEITRHGCEGLRHRPRLVRPIGRLSPDSGLRM